MHARQQRLPAGEVVEVMEIPTGNGWTPGIRDPAEELCPVEQLEPVGEPAQPDVAREPLRQPSVGGRGLAVIRVRRDDRGAGV